MGTGFQFVYSLPEVSNAPMFCFFQGRIKKIMQTDEEVGKVAQAVPVIIYILFKRNGLRKSLELVLGASSRNNKAGNANCVGA